MDNAQETGLVFEVEPPMVSPTKLEAIAIRIVEYIAQTQMPTTQTLADLAEELGEATAREMSARVPAPRLLEVTGNVEERELAARYMESKVKGALHHATNARSGQEKADLEHIAECFRAAAQEFRGGLHLPLVHIEGKIIPYNEDNDTGVKHAVGVQALVTDIHARNVKAGWWHDLSTGEPLERNVGELLMLMVSELAEAMEGHRKGLMDDKLPERSMIEVELADCIIRIADAAGGLGLDLGGAIDEKLAFNATRADHKLENRLAEGGKKY